MKPEKQTPEERAAKAKAWRDAHKAEKAEYDRLRAQEKPRDRREYHKKYYQEHREYQLEMAKRRREDPANRERLLKAHAKYNEKLKMERAKAKAERENRLREEIGTEKYEKLLKYRERSRERSRRLRAERKSKNTE